MSETNTLLPQLHKWSDAFWFDCGEKITGESILELSDNFNEIWKHKIRYGTENQHLPFRTNNNIIKRQHKNSELIRLLEFCENRIWITNAYMAPSRRIINALKLARLNGVDVKLIISRHSDVVFSINKYNLLLRIYAIRN